MMLVNYIEKEIEKHKVSKNILMLKEVQLGRIFYNHLVNDMSVLNPNIDKKTN